MSLTAGQESQGVAARGEVAAEVRRLLPLTCAARLRSGAADQPPGVSHAVLDPQLDTRALHEHAAAILPQPEIERLRRQVHVPFQVQLLALRAAAGRGQAGGR